MSLALDAAFSAFIGRITPDPRLVELGRTRAEGVVELLRKGFQVHDKYLTGSLFRGTALPNISDADVIVTLDVGFGVTAKSLMERVQQHLSPLHRGTQVRKDGQALTLHFETWPNVDLVLAKKRMNPLIPSPADFEIADVSNDRWLPSFSRRHDEAMKIMSDEYFQLIRMVKMWNHLHSGYLSSFHIETFALIDAMDRRRNSWIYPPPKYKPNDAQHGWTWATLFYFMKFLEAYGVPTFILDEEKEISPSIFRRMQHPIPGVGRVDDYFYGVTQVEGLKRVRRAYKHSADAFNAAYPTGGWGRPGPDEQGAVDSLRQIFGDKFPSTCPA